MSTDNQAEHGPCLGCRIQGGEAEGNTATPCTCDAAPLDGPCDDCGRRYPAWRTEHDLWNTVMGGPEATDDPGGLLCPTCFLIRADTALDVGLWLVAVDRRPGGESPDCATHDGCGWCVNHDCPASACVHEHQADPSIRPGGSTCAPTPCTRCEDETRGLGSSHPHTCERPSRPAISVGGEDRG